jgi:hypothetical protein
MGVVYSHASNDVYHCSFAAYYYKVNPFHTKWLFVFIFILNTDHLHIR